MIFESITSSLRSWWNTKTKSMIVDLTHVQFIQSRNNTDRHTIRGCLVGHHNVENESFVCLNLCGYEFIAMVKFSKKSHVTYVGGTDVGNRNAGIKDIPSTHILVTEIVVTRM